TTQMTARSRRGSEHSVQGSIVSTFPHWEHTVTLSRASAIAVASGARSLSRFLMRWRAARLADRGPSPGSFASAWISRSISGPVVPRVIRTNGEAFRPPPHKGEGNYWGLPKSPVEKEWDAWSLPPPPQKGGGTSGRPQTPDGGREGYSWRPPPPLGGGGGGGGSLRHGACSFN